jgi:hypothetical protein
MIFIKAPISGDYFPSYYRNDYIGVERYSVTAKENDGARRFFHVLERMQADQAKFANTWMRNIRHQQHLFEKRPQASPQLSLEVAHV